MGKSEFWTPATVEKLRLLAEMRLSSGAIAHVLGCTRNMVVSKCKKHGFALRGLVGTGDLAAMTQEELDDMLKFLLPEQDFDKSERLIEGHFAPTSIAKEEDFNNSERIIEGDCGPASVVQAETPAAAAPFYDETLEENDRVSSYSPETQEIPEPCEDGVLSLFERIALKSDGDGVPLWSLQPFHCRAIIAGDATSVFDIRYCGVHTVEGGSWCKAHLARYVTSTENRLIDRDRRILRSA